MTAVNYLLSTPITTLIPWWLRTIISLTIIFFGFKLLEFLWQKGKVKWANWKNTKKTSKKFTGTPPDGVIVVEQKQKEGEQKQMSEIRPTNLNTGEVKSINNVYNL